MVSQKLFHLLALALTCPAVLARPAPNITLTSRQANTANFEVDTYAALGDSFSAGPSAGLPREVDPDDAECVRYTGAYPPLVNADGRIDDGGFERTFQFKACTGALMDDVISKQLPSTSTIADMVTLTISGNDVFFGNIVRNCVYGVWTNAPCSTTMLDAKNEMVSVAFRDKFDAVLQGIWNKNTAAHVFVPLYPRFFNPTTPQCSTTCFTPWPTCAEEYLLTTQRRTDLNDLVDLLNVQIKAAIHRNPPPEGSTGQLEWIDTNTSFEGHRFCEDGVIEPKKDNSSIWFYHLQFSKPPFPFLLDYDTSGCNGLLPTAELGDFLGCDLARAIAEDPSKQDQLTQSSVIAYTEPGAESNPADRIELQRTFHPTTFGMAAFRDDIIEAYQNPVLPASPPAPFTPHVLCGLGNYANVTRGGIQHGYDYLEGARGQQFCVDPNSCGAPTCYEGTKISVCNDQTQQVCVDLGIIGDQVTHAEGSCGTTHTCTEGNCGGIDQEYCCSDSVFAFQNFVLGYNILVHGDTC